MFHSSEQTARILAEQKIMRSGKASGLNLCKYGRVSCVRCCLPHIGEDSYIEDSGEERPALLRQSKVNYQLQYSGRYLGPGGLLMKFQNFNPLKDPRIEASQYEDCFQDVGREEMERRFSERRSLFLQIYDRKQPRQTLPLYMEAAQRHEGYRYAHEENSGLASLYIGGSVSKKHVQKGELPECQLLGFVDADRTVGCMAHPLAKSSQGYDGRDQVGFFHHTGCCDSVGCEASKEFPFLSPSAMKIFDKAIDGMSWYEYSRHATSVLVYYLRSYDHVFQKLDDGELLETSTLQQLVAFTNALYEEWPLKKPADSAPTNFIEILAAEIPVAERILYIALNTDFMKDNFPRQLRQARDRIKKHIEAGI